MTSEARASGHLSKSPIAKSKLGKTTLQDDGLKIEKPGKNDAGNKYWKCNKRVNNGLCQRKETVDLP